MEARLYEILDSDDVWYNFVGKIPEKANDKNFSLIVMNSVQKLNKCKKDWEDFYRLPIHSQVFFLLVNNDIISHKSYKKYLELVSNNDKIVTYDTLTGIELYSECGSLNITPDDKITDILYDSIDFSLVTPEVIEELRENYNVFIRYATKNYDYDILWYLISRLDVKFSDVVEYINDDNYKRIIELFHIIAHEDGISDTNFYSQLIGKTYREGKTAFAILYMSAFTRESLEKLFEYYYPTLVIDKNVIIASFVSVGLTKDYLRYIQDPVIQNWLSRN